MSTVVRQVPEDAVLSEVEDGDSAEETNVLREAKTTLTPHRLF